MKYATFIGTTGAMPEDALAIMNGAFPAFLEEMRPRGVLEFGRELDFPDTAVTVRVRDGETLVTDGPFAETKEFAGGMEVLECADLDEAIEVVGKNPVTLFHPFEIRPFSAGVRIGPAATAFGAHDDAGGVPYLLAVWVDDPATSHVDDATLQQECDDWRNQQESAGGFVLGSPLAGPETATTLRLRGGEPTVSDGSFLGIDAFIASVDIVTYPDRQLAIDSAAAHPLARVHAIEVRPFYSAERAEKAPDREDVSA